MFTTINDNQVINYKGVNYPTKTFTIIIGEEPQEVTISVDSLSNAMTNELMEKFDTEENNIDNNIYFYVADDVIDLPNDVIAGSYLDEAFILYNEEE